MDNGKTLLKNIKVNELGIAKIDSNLSIDKLYNIIVYDEKNGDISFLSNIQIFCNDDAFIKNEEFIWHIITDRGCYNPKDKLICQGYLRKKILIGDDNILSSTNT